MKKAILIASILFVLLLLVLVIGCPSAPAVQYTYQPPENIGDGLEVGTLDEVNIDSALIERAVSDISRGKYKEVHSMLIFRDGRLVLEEYFTGHKYQWEGANYHGELVTWDRDMPHSIHSDTKSVTSACIGIAIYKGFIESVHQSIFDYLPEHQHLNTDGKNKITIEHLLTMTSGLDWKEWSAPYSSKDNPIIGIWFSDKDPITYILERSLRAESGTSFTYYGGNQIVLGEIIRYATGMNIDEFSREYLFEPLGISSFDWAVRFENGVIEAAGGLKMTPRDMTKFGVAFLNDGVWDGQQIISEQWVEKSATAYANNEGIDVPSTDQRNVGYSYSWWTKTFSDSGKEINMFYAGGWGGQNIMIFPELNTVVVFTGGNYTSKTYTITILERYIIPALN
jgi:CubicO group peptidase (beta-lactamase class C family)